MSRPYDVIIFGATGNTGTDAAKYLAALPNRPSFALAGRSEAKLKALKDSLCQNGDEGTSSSSSDIGVIVANVTDDEALRTMAKQARLVMNYAGPYKQYGEAVIKACIAEKTHHADITGEVPWVDSMRAKYDEEAKAQGVSVVSFCAFDCIPAELSATLGIRELARQAAEKETCENEESDEGKSEEKKRCVRREIEYVVCKEGSTGVPRGSMLTFLEMQENPPSTAEIFNYVAEPAREAARRFLRSHHMLPSYSKQVNAYTVPNIMALINIPVVANTLHTMTKVPTTFWDRVLMGSRSKRTPLANLLTFYNFVPSLILCLSQLTFFCLLMNGWIRNKITAMVTKSYNYTGNPKARFEVLTRVTEHYEDSEPRVANVRFGINGDPGIVGTSFLSVETIVTLLQNEATLPRGFTTPVLACGEALEKRLIEQGATCEVIPTATKSKDA